LKIPDGSYVVTTGYLSKDARGPLGVYPAHIIVDRVKVLRKNTAVGAHSLNACGLTRRWSERPPAARSPCEWTWTPSLRPTLGSRWPSLILFSLNAFERVQRS
jgi:hypothetical protein